MIHEVSQATLVGRTVMTASVRCRILSPKAVILRLSDPMAESHLQVIALGRANSLGEPDQQDQQ